MTSRIFDVSAVCVLAVAGAVALGVDFRASFPLGDGGLFYAIISAIERDGLPREIVYNGEHLPFTYSPLAFYLVAAIGRVSGLPVETAMNLWVSALALAYGPAFYWIATRFFADRRAAFAAALLATCASELSVLLGMGGGVTRLPGMLGLTASAGASLALRVPSVRCSLLVGTLVGLTALVHMEFGMLAAISVAVLALMRRYDLGNLALAAVTTVAISAPWIVFALLRYGPHPFQNASHTAYEPGLGAPIALLIAFGVVTNNVVGAAGFAALVAAALGGRYLFALWTIATVAFDTRAGLQVSHLPLALAGGDALEAFGPRRGGWPRTFAFVGLVVAALLGLGEATGRAAAVVRTGPSDVAAMRWIAANAPPDAAVLVFDPPGPGRPIVDYTYEWLPVLAQRYSPLAFEGLEWTDPHRLHTIWVENLRVRFGCNTHGARCVRDALKRLPAGSWRDATYVYVARRSSAYDAFVASLGRENALHAVRTTSDNITYLADPRGFR